MPLPQEIAPWNFYRLGPAKEKELFKRHRNTYSGVAISAHLASYYQKFCLEFVGELQKPYFIDPVTHIFAADPDSLLRFLKDKTTMRTKRDQFGNKIKGGLKRSIQKLTTAYGPIAEKIVKDGRRARLSDFSDDAKTLDFVKRVCAFQTEMLSELPQKYKKYQKYAIKAGALQTGVKNYPAFVIPPYFPIVDEGWLALNAKMTKLAKQFAGELPIFSVIAGEVDKLQGMRSAIVEAYSKLELSGFLLWGDGFKGDQGSSSITAYRSVVKALAGDKGQPVIALYGDALSLILAYGGLTGFSCGICYGEKRGCDQDMDIEGALPPFYYIARLKRKYQLETDIRRVNLNQHVDLLCPCAICSGTADLLSLDDSQTKEHFMLARQLEIDAIRGGLSAAAIKKQLQDAYEKYKNTPPFSGSLDHLMTWARLL
ncbi:MAG: hypothetical protein ABSD44_11735 [Terracidiphilus sp.]|jgi:hypothetical protein